VQRISLSADPDTRLYRVELLLDNPDLRVQPGSLVSPEILVSFSDELPAVPASAVFSADGREYVYAIVREGDHYEARLRLIEAAARNASLVAVRSGVAEGETVAVWGKEKLQDGTKVWLRETVGYEPEDIDSAARGDSE